MSVKAFEFVLIIETLQLVGEKAQTKIECIECCGKELYFGTSDSFLILYTLEEKYLSKLAFHDTPFSRLSMFMN
jgi:hypothetical protein